MYVRKPTKWKSYNPEKIFAAMYERQRVNIFIF